MIVFRQPIQDMAVFEASYTAFLRLAEQIPDIERRQVVHVLGSPDGATDIHRILELYFADQPTMLNALNSEAGQRAGAGLHAGFTAQSIRVETLFADVYEEQGGATPNTGATTDDASGA